MIESMAAQGLIGEGTLPQPGREHEPAAWLQHSCDLGQRRRQQSGWQVDD